MYHHIILLLLRLNNILIHFHTLICTALISTGEKSNSSTSSSTCAHGIGRENLGTLKETEGFFPMVLSQIALQRTAEEKIVGAAVGRRPYLRMHSFFSFPSILYCMPCLSSLVVVVVPPNHCCWAEEQKPPVL